MSLADFEDLLKASMGLDAASVGASAIERAVQQRQAACNAISADAYLERLRASDTELQQLIEAVVVSETWFLRDRDAFTALASLMREEWLQTPPPRVLTLLSIPCSTGEEPYSMAMALLDAAIPPDRFRIDGIDISGAVVKHAAASVYGKNSFRGNDLSFRDRHFEATDRGFRVSDAVRQQVHFEQGNLFAADFLPGDDRYDVIFCRNVLIYFDRVTQDRAIGVLRRLLKANGTLFVAPAETGLPGSHGFAPMSLPQACAFRRATRGQLDRKKTPDAVERTAVRRPPRVAPPPHAQAKPAAAATAPRAHAVVLSPVSDAATIVAEAMRLADEGHLVEAATCCEDLLRRHGPSASAFHLMGLVRDATGNQIEAAKYYRKALYLDPNHADALAHLALLLETQGDLPGALVLRKRARRLESPGQPSHG